MVVMVGIPACAREVNFHLHHATPARYGAALLGGAGATPVLIPPIGAAALKLLDRLDGLLVPGSPSNVLPAHYGAVEDLTPDRHDPARDETTLGLIRAAIARGLPLFAICRGIQELNVALGGSLHQQVHNVPGRRDHRGGPGEMETRYGPKHGVRLEGELARLIGETEIDVNSLHEQAIDRLAPGLVAEAWAEDGTIEGVRAAGESFAYGVQWHPEWRYAENPASKALFAAFGEACRRYAAPRDQKIAMPPCTG